MNAPFACAYVLSQDGYVRFVTYSASMRDCRFWITPGIAVPTGSITGQCLKADSASGAGIVPAYLWTSVDAFAGMQGTAFEEVCAEHSYALSIFAARYRRQRIQMDNASAMA